MQKRSEKRKKISEVSEVKVEKLKIIEFGDPLLRKSTRDITISGITHYDIQNLIKSMRELLVARKLGVGLAAPQVGKDLSLAVVAIRPSEHRPKVKPFDLTIINPKITETVGKRKQLYEGCISGGPDKTGLFARVPRYTTIKVKYYDEKGKLHNRKFDGLAAHVIQHEIDHLNDMLFVDQVKDTKSYMTYKEYVKFAKAQTKLKNVKKIK